MATTSQNKTIYEVYMSQGSISGANADDLMLFARTVIGGTQTYSDTYALSIKDILNTAIYDDVEDNLADIFEESYHPSCVQMNNEVSIAITASWDLEEGEDAPKGEVEFDVIISWTDEEGNTYSKDGGKITVTSDDDWVAYEDGFTRFLDTRQEIEYSYTIICDATLEGWDCSSISLDSGSDANDLSYTATFKRSS